MSDQTIETPEVLQGVTGDGTETPRRGRGRPRGSRNRVTNGTPEAGNSEAGATTPRATVTVDEINEINLEDISGADLAVNVSGMLVSMSAPVRKRSERQAAMDAVAMRAYSKWVADGRPSAWGKLPIVTYMVLPERVARYNYLIKRACEFVTPEPYEVPVMVTDEATGNEVEVKDEDGKPITETYTAPGVRVRFGTSFTLTPELIERVNATALQPIPDEYAGRVVIAWAAVDKRNRAVATSDESDEADEDEADEADSGDE
jgi:hypothetical protein